MKTFWLCATLLPLFLFSNALPEKECKWKDRIPEIQRVQVHSNLSVPCPRPTESDMTFMLYKGPTQVVTGRSGNITKLTKTQLTVTHDINQTTNSTCFILYNVLMEDTGLYTCTAEKTYPPPFIKIQEEPQTIVIVENSKCEPRSKNSANHLLLWVGLGILSFYGLVITVIALLLRFRLKQEDMKTHDYMNMKPRTRRKKQGIHHPTNLSWYNDTPNGKAVSKKLPSKGTSV